MNRPKKIEIVTHYSIEDTECCGEYYDIEIFIDEKLVKEYGDYYHDKGEAKAEGFIDALRLVFEKLPKIKQSQIADRDY